MMTLIIHLFHSRDVVVVVSQLLFVAHAVVPVAQFLIPSATDIQVLSRFHVERICKNDASQNEQLKATYWLVYIQGFSPCKAKPCSYSYQSQSAGGHIIYNNCITCCAF